MPTLFVSHPQLNFSRMLYSISSTGWVSCQKSIHDAEEVFHHLTYNHKIFSWMICDTLRMHTVSGCVCSAFVPFFWWWNKIWRWLFFFCGVEQCKLSTVSMFPCLQIIFPPIVTFHFSCITRINYNVNNITPLLEDIEKCHVNFLHAEACPIDCVMCCACIFVVFLLQPGKASLSTKQGSGIPSLASSKQSKLATPTNYKQSPTSSSTPSASTPKRPQSIPVPQSSTSADQVISQFMFAYPGWMFTHLFILILLCCLTIAHLFPKFFFLLLMAVDVY